VRVLYINTSTGWGGMEMHPMVVGEELARRGTPLFFGIRREHLRLSDRTVPVRTLGPAAGQKDAAG